MNEQLHKQMSSILKQLANSSDDVTSTALAKQAWALYDANPGVWTSGVSVK